MIEFLHAAKRQCWRTREVERALRRLPRARLSSPAELIEAHEIALFLRAYPASPAVVELCERFLGGVAARLGDDLLPYEEAEVSGIAGTRLTAVFSYPVARHLAARHPASVSIDWERHEEADRFFSLLPELVPLLEDDAQVEAHVPWRDWLEEAAGGAANALPWLLAALERHEPDERRRAARYHALGLPLRWEFGGSAATRTLMRHPTGELFYHREPLIPRSAVTLAGLRESAPLPSRPLSPAAGAAVLALARDTSAARYRELHGFSYGDPASVIEVQAGRGVVFYFSALLPAHRLPLRAYHAASIWKNGVPAGYFEALSLFERLEAGFNLYFTFREGETAWLYRQLLAMFHQLLGVRVFTLDPYQVGHENVEGIRSGAFWFYRKLGFRSTDARCQALIAAEERKLAARPEYRTPPGVLRRIVRHPLVYELPGEPVGDWDGFETRRLGLAATRAPQAAVRELIRLKRSRDDRAWLAALQSNPRLRQQILRLGRT
jgi:hypothetical protein